MDIFIRKRATKTLFKGNFYGHEVIKGNLNYYLGSNYPHKGTFHSPFDWESFKQKTYITFNLGKKECSFSLINFLKEKDYYIGLKLKNVFKFKKEQISSEWYKITFSVLTIKPLYRC